jgi:hypothetical protein
MSRKARTSATQKHRAATRTTSRTPWLLGLGAVVVIVVVAVVAIALASSGPSIPEPATAPVVVTGTSLPEIPAQGGDPAIGMMLPTIQGTDLEGASLTIGPATGAQAIVILAHWCPHCQNEVPRLVDWLANNPPPDGVSVVGLSSLIDPARANYPPSDWLAREGWEQPTLNDDALSAAYRALGSLSTPGFVFVSADGTISGRSTGEMDVETFGQILDELAP